MTVVHKTIIVGGGIAGLSCARELTNRSEEFILITQDLGGRIKFSADGTVNYGALWIGSNYRHMSKIVQLGRQVNWRELYFYSHSGKKPFKSIVLRHPIQLLRVLILTIRFYFAYKKFQNDAEAHSQKEVIESSPYLKKIFFQSATDYIRENRIEDFAKSVIEPIMYGIMVARLSEQTAFQFLLMSLPLLVRVYEFQFDVQKFTKPFASHILLDEVISIDRSSDSYILRTNSGKELHAKNVVVAVPSLIAQKLLRLPRINDGKELYVYHLAGKVKERYKDGTVKFFGYTEPILDIIEKNRDNYIVYTLTEKVDFSQWFEKWNIIASTRWLPIYNDIGNILLDANQGNGLWLIGDHNIIGMEDAFISGLYAAQKIQGKA